MTTNVEAVFQHAVARAEKDNLDPAVFAEGAMFGWGFAIGMLEGLARESTSHTQVLLMAAATIRGCV